MSDVPINRTTTERVDVEPKKDKKSNVVTDLENKIAVERGRAEAAETTIKEMESAPFLLVVLDPKELAGISRQKTFMQEAVEKANATGKEAADSQVVALMLNNAYTTAWVSIQRKYGLPEDVDVDWTTGEIFRKKPNIDNAIKG